MRDVDLVIRNGVVVTMNSSGTVHERADIVVDDGAIVAIEPDAKPRGQEEISATDAAVIPGLVNAHMHETLLRGACEDRPLHRWLEELCFPMEQALQPRHTLAASKMNQIEMIQGGTTTFVDMYRHLDLVTETVANSGLRAILCPQVMELGTGRGETWDEAESFLRSMAGTEHDRISTWIGPHAPYTVSSDGYRRAVRLARELELRVHTHLCETELEIEMIVKREGMRPVDWLESIGAMEALVCAHGVVLTDADRELFVRRGASIAHNPSSNMKLASGVAEIGKAQATGIAVGLGTDSVLSNNNLDMIEETRLAGLLQKVALKDAEALPAFEALRLATMGSAEAIGMADQIGSLEVGKRADLAVIGLKSPHMWPALTKPICNIVEQIVYASNGADVSHTIVDGTVLMRERELLTLDADEARNEVHAAAAELLRQINR